jgi:hypothetical protein
MKTWKKPAFIELCMNAEIGAYQEDTGEEREPPLISAADAPSERLAVVEPPEGEAGHVA